MKINRRDFLSFAGLGSAAFISGRRDLNRLYSEKDYQTNSYEDVWIELKLENMEWNLEQIRKFVEVPIMAVIKCNGYGHGLVEVGRCLDQKKDRCPHGGQSPRSVKIERGGCFLPHS